MEKAEKEVCGYPEAVGTVVTEETGEITAAGVAVGGAAQITQEAGEPRELVLNRHPRKRATTLTLAPKLRLR